MGSPIKRSSVKENASPGKETVIAALLRYGRVADILRVCLYPDGLNGSVIPDVLATFRDLPPTV